MSTAVACKRRRREMRLTSQVRWRPCTGGDGTLEFPMKRTPRYLEYLLPSWHRTKVPGLCGNSPVIACSGLPSSRGRRTPTFSSPPDRQVHPGQQKPVLAPPRAQRVFRLWLNDDKRSFSENFALNVVSTSPLPGFSATICAMSPTRGCPWPSRRHITLAATRLTRL